MSLPGADSVGVWTLSVTRWPYACAMEPGIAEVLGPAPQPTRIIRTLWRMQGPSRIIAARVERHPFGRELVVVFEGPGRDDVLETRYERYRHLGVYEESGAVRS